MKKIVRILTAVIPLLAAVLPAAATEDGVYINFSTSVGMSYPDGTPILDGECFVLVWTDTGVTIDLTKDIVGDQNSFLEDDWCWMATGLAKGGKCDSVVFSWPYDDYYGRGTAQLYLLDTRISATELAPWASNSEGGEFPTVINAVVPVQGASCSWSNFFTTPVTIIGSVAPAATDWTVFKTIVTTVPTPVIVSCVHTNGVFSVGVTNTVTAANYVLKMCGDVGFTNVLWTSSSKAGLADACAVLVIDDANATNSAAFYKIEAK